MANTVQNNIEYFDLVGFAESTVSMERIETVRVVHVVRNMIEQFIVDMLGKTTRTAPGVLSRIPPEQHPIWVQTHCVEAVELPDALGIPTDDGANFISYGTTEISNNDALTRVRLTYRALDYPVRADSEVEEEATPEKERYISRYETYATEAVVVPGNSFKFVDDPVPIPEQGSKFGFTKEVTFVWHQVLRPNQTVFEQAIGTCNSAIFDSKAAFAAAGVNWPARIGYAAETLLFIAPDVKPWVTWYNEVAYEVSLKFLYREQGWNTFYRKGDGAMVPPGFKAIISNDGLGTKLYPTAPFDGLFTVG